MYHEWLKIITETPTSKNLLSVSCRPQILDMKIVSISRYAKHLAIWCVSLMMCVMCVWFSSDHSQENMPLIYGSDWNNMWYWWYDELFFYNLEYHYYDPNNIFYWIVDYSISLMQQISITT